MMTLKFNRNAKVTCALTGPRLARPATDDGFKTFTLPLKDVPIQKLEQSSSC